MTSWIVAIANTHPQHWAIAKKHGFWDMTKRAEIAAGDPVYFWLTKKSLLGRTVATSDATAIAADDRLPWEDSGVRTYTTRFDFRLVSDDPTAQPRWGEVVSATRVRAGLNFGPQRVDDPAGERWLAAQFGGTTVAVEYAFPSDERQLELEALLHDARERALRTIALRQGQPAFRAALLSAYTGACAITGYATESVLEAAHISPYLGGHTNVTANGLLLRADIHTLFDRFLLTATPGYVVRVAPELSSGPYGALSGSALRVPADPQHQPSRDALRSHNAGCAWLSTANSTTP